MSRWDFETGLPDSDSALAQVLVFLTPGSADPGDYRQDRVSWKRGGGGRGGSWLCRGVKGW